MESNIFFELLNNPFLKNDSVISTRFVSNPGIQTKDSLGIDSLYEKIFQENINLLKGGISLKNEYLNKFQYLEISFNNTWNFSYESIDINYIDKFYVDLFFEVDDGCLPGLYIKTQEGLWDGLSRLVPVETTINTQLGEGIDECEIDYRQYRSLHQIYWFTMYSKFNINICVPPPLHWRKNDQRFKNKGEFFEINLVSTEVTLFINLLKIFPFELAKILYQIFKNVELNLFEDFVKQIVAISLDKQCLQRTKELAIESLQKNRRLFKFDKMQFETREGQYPELDSLYIFDLTDEGFIEFTEFRDFLINGPFHYPIQDDVMKGLNTALFGAGAEVVIPPAANWVKFHEEFLIIKGFY